MKSSSRRTYREEKLIDVAIQRYRFERSAHRGEKVSMQERTNWSTRLCNAIREVMAERGMDQEVGK